MKKNLNKNIINITIVVIMFLILLSYMILVDGWANVVTVIKQIKPVWFAVAGVLILIYWLLEASVLYIVTKKVCGRKNFFDTLRVSMIGQLFNNITPFSSGGQPMQAITMTKSGVSVSSSITILLVKFIVYQLVLVIYTSIVMIFKYAYFKELVSNFVFFSIVGFIINLVVIIVLVTIGINKNFIYSIIKPIYEYLNKINFLKKADEKLEKLRKDMNIFHEEFKIIKREKMMILKTCILTVVQFTAFSSITYAVYRAFGNNGHSIIDIISAQIFLMMIMAFIPTPGAGGAAEGGFYVIFKTFFVEKEIKMAILFWRLYTFYMPILIGTIFLLFKFNKKDEIIEPIKDKAEEVLKIDIKT